MKTIRTSKKRILRQLSSLFRVNYTEEEHKFRQAFDESETTAEVPILLVGTLIFPDEVSVVFEVTRKKKSVLDQYFEEAPDMTIILKDINSPSKESLFICLQISAAEEEESVNEIVPEKSFAFLGKIKDGYRKVAFPINGCIKETP